MRPLGHLLVWLLWLWLGLLALFVAAWHSLPWWAPLLQAQLGANLNWQRLHTGWQGGRLSLQLQGLQWQEQQLEQLWLEWDVVRSLYSFRPIFTSLQVQGADLQVAAGQDAAGLALNWPAMAPWLLAVPIQLERVQFTYRGQRWQLQGYQQPLAEGQSEGRIQLALAGAQALELQWQGNAKQGQGYLRLPEQSYHSWWQAYQQQWPALAQWQLKGGAELWFDWADKQLQSANGFVDLSQLRWQSAQNQVSWQQVRSQVVYDGHRQWWGLHQLNWQQSVGQQTTPLNVTWEQGRQRLTINRVELAGVWQWLAQQQFADAQVSQTLIPLAARGHLRNLLLQWQQEWSLTADLDQVHTQAMQNIPQLQVERASLWLTEQGGQVSLDGAPFAMAFPELYTPGWRFEQAQGVIGWRMQEDGVWLNTSALRLQRPGLDAKGRFALSIPKDDAPSHFSLVIGLQNAEGSQGLELVPDKQIDPSLWQWLQQGQIDAQVRRGAFIYDGVTREDPQWLAHGMQLYLELAQARLQFSPQWPALEQAGLQLYLHNDELQVSADRGQLGGLELQQIAVRWPLAEGDKRLGIDSRYQASLPQVQAFLQGMPISPKLDALAQLSLEGQSQGQVQLALPLLSDTKPLELAVEAQVDAKRLALPLANLNLSQVQGQLYYQQDKGLYTRQPLQGKWLDNTVNATLQPGRHQAISLQVTGQHELQQLAKWLDWPLPEWARGPLAWQVEKNFCSHEDCEAIQISSDLQGVELALPSPLGKTAQQSRGLNIRLWPEQPLRVALDAETLSARLRMGEKGLQQAEVKLNAGVAQWRKAEGISLEAKLLQWQPAQWLALSWAKAPGLPSLPVQAKVETAALLLGEQDWGKLAIELQRQDNRSQVSLQGERIAGQLSFHPQLWQAHLSHLWLPAPPETDNNQPPVWQDPWAEWRPQQWPAMQIELGDFKLGQWPLGQWQVQGQPSEQGYRWQKIRADWPQHRLDAQLSWQAGQAANSSVMLNLAGKDVGHWLESAGYARSLTSQQWTLQSDLGWSGSPAAFALAFTDGSLDLQLHKGEILKVGAESQALKIFNIFNFTQIGRRLAFDFRDLFSSGISYDRWRSLLQMKQGVLFTSEPTLVEGPGAKIAAEGSLDLVKDEVDHRVTLALPLTSALPLAALLAGVPQVGGALFVLDKLTGDSLSKLTTVSYSVQGKLGQEEIKLVGATGFPEGGQ
ncbi:YhdP family phospholipid transporter [Balneatrix alpica]|uniref:YhdP family phospholipid transporter n=1 Tax=Balneatrix alpica TaxID=75684 RepID=UPI0027395874|nr:AsmA-like C-terminal region-containing protein [Balneatrix alpica]